MRAYRCRGCGRGLTSDVLEFAPCPRCGSSQWNKLKGLTHFEMVKLLWITRGKHIVPPQGSLVERVLLKIFTDTKETGVLARGGPRPQ